MLSNWCNLFLKRCPPVTKRIILIPIAILGILGFLINTQIQLIPLSSSTLCRSKTHIVFLKTHKCAGSSIQNILMRYGDAHGLNFVLPRTGNYLGHPQLFHRSMVGKPKIGFTFHILAHHTRLNYPEIRAVMPRDSVYITIVRDPIQVFESSFSYYNFDRLFHCNIHKFIENLGSFSQAFLSRRFRGKFGANQMFFDLGGETSIFANESLVKQHIDYLETLFDLVLIAEHMDESLILLRHLLCWDIDDVVTFKLNARHPRFISNLTDTEKSQILKLNHADQLLYNLFLAKHEEQVKHFGVERMDAEVAELRRITNNWYELCVMGESPFKKGTSKQKHYINPRVLRIETKKDVANNTCSAMTMEELIFTDQLRQRQLFMYPFSFSPVRNISRQAANRFKKQTPKSSKLK